MTIYFHDFGFYMGTNYGNDQQEIADVDADFANYAIGMGVATEVEEEE